MASEEDLLRAVKDNLRRSGKLNKIKAQMREEVMNILQPSDSNPKPDIPSESELINELIREYLSWHGYHFTTSVLSAEAGMSSQPVDRRYLINSIGVVETERTSKLPLLYSLVHTFKEMLQQP